MDVHVYYDDSFHTRFGVRATRRILAVFTMIKTIFSHSSLPAVIEPNVIDISYLRGSNWEANMDTLEYEQNFRRNIPQTASTKGCDFILNNLLIFQISVLKHFRK